MPSVEPSSTGVGHPPGVRASFRIFNVKSKRVIRSAPIARGERPLGALLLASTLERNNGAQDSGLYGSLFYTGWMRWSAYLFCLRVERSCSIGGDFRALFHLSPPTGITRHL